MSGIPDFKNLVFKDTSFANLMNKRIYNVLLIATKYDAFMLEDDGRVDEQIFNEYTSLSLRYPPRFTQVTTEDEALAELQDRNFELIICMPNMDNRDIFAAATEIKSRYPNIPIVVLTPFSREVSKRIANEDLSAIDYVFSWLGNSELLLAIIKLIEDKMNAPDDTASVGVQIILLVEDSIRFYSSALPHLYKFVLEQSQMFAKEALNAHEQTLRMRGRPKIKLARTYEEAVRIFDQYRDNILGIISDMSFMHDGAKDPYAGYKFGQYVRKTGLIIPFVLESSEARNKVYAEELGASFIDKNSKSYPQDLRKKILPARPAEENHAAFRLWRLHHPESTDQRGDYAHSRLERLAAEGFPDTGRFAGLPPEPQPFLPFLLFACHVPAGRGTEAGRRERL